ncbi:MAG: hypothetical protein ABIN25_07060 [Ginsengibacter sp.]
MFFIFLAFFSLQAYSQDTKESSHPLLDKYYPRAEKDTSANVTAAPQPTPQFVQPPVAAPIVTPPPPPPPQPAPVATTTVSAPINNATLPVEKIATGTILRDTLTINKTIPETVPQPETQIVAETIPSLNTTNVPVTNQPVVTGVLVPAQKVIQPRPASTTPMMDTRLGSSTPAYDTWKKNNNGAGSVTTSVK